MATTTTLTAALSLSTVPVRRNHAYDIVSETMSLNAAVTVSGDSGILMMRMCKIPTNSVVVGINAWVGQVTNGGYSVVVDDNTLATASIGSYISTFNLGEVTATTTASHSSGFVYAYLRSIPGTDTASVLGGLTIMYRPV